MIQVRNHNLLEAILHIHAGIYCYNSGLMQITKHTMINTVKPYRICLNDNITSISRFILQPNQRGIHQIANSVLGL
jgi:hypothetical protein